MPLIQNGRSSIHIVVVVVVVKIIVSLLFEHPVYKKIGRDDVINVYKDAMSMQFNTILYK